MQLTVAVRVVLEQAFAELPSAAALLWIATVVFAFQLVFAC